MIIIIIIIIMVWPACRCVSGEECSDDFATDYHATWASAQATIGGYHTIAVMGAQSSGKSTLLNALFGTGFRVMDATQGRSQTTRGVWLAEVTARDQAKDKASTPAPGGGTILVFDVEGTDSLERGEHHVSLARKTTLFSLAMCEVLMINIAEIDIGRYEGSSYSLLRGVIELYLSTFVAHATDDTDETATVTTTTTTTTTMATSSEKEGQGQDKHHVRTRLLFVVRDHMVSSVEQLEAQLNAFVHGLWDKVEKHSTVDCALEDLFDIDFACFVPKPAQEATFLQQVDALRARLPSMWHPSYSRNILGDGVPVYACGVWTAILQNGAVDVPSQRAMIAVYRCRELIDEAISSVRQALSELVPPTSTCDGGHEASESDSDRDSAHTAVAVYISGMADAVNEAVTTFSRVSAMYGADAVAQARCQLGEQLMTLLRDPVVDAFAQLRMVEMAQLKTFCSTALNPGYDQQTVDTTVVPLLYNIVSAFVRRARVDSIFGYNPRVGRTGPSSRAMAAAIEKGPGSASSLAETEFHFLVQRVLLHVAPLLLVKRSMEALSTPTTTTTTTATVPLGGSSGSAPLDVAAGAAAAGIVANEDPITRCREHVAVSVKHWNATVDILIDALRPVGIDARTFRGVFESAVDDQFLDKTLGDTLTKYWQGVSDMLNRTLVSMCATVGTQQLTDNGGVNAMDDEDCGGTKAARRAAALDVLVAGGERRRQASGSGDRDGPLADAEHERAKLHAVDDLAAESSVCKAFARLGLFYNVFAQLRRVFFNAGMDAYMEQATSGTLVAALEGLARVLPNAREALVDDAQAIFSTLFDRVTGQDVIEAAVNASVGRSGGVGAAGAGRACVERAYDDAEVAALLFVDAHQELPSSVREGLVTLASIGRVDGDDDVHHHHVKGQYEPPALDGDAADNIVDVTEDMLASRASLFADRVFRVASSSTLIGCDFVRDANVRTRPFVPTLAQPLSSSTTATGGRTAAANVAASSDSKDTTAFSASRSSSSSSSSSSSDASKPTSSLACSSSPSLPSTALHPGGLDVQQRRASGMSISSAVSSSRLVAITAHELLIDLMSDASKKSVVRKVKQFMTKAKSQRMERALSAESRAALQFMVKRQGTSVHAVPRWLWVVLAIVGFNEVVLLVTSPITVTLLLLMTVTAFVLFKIGVLPSAVSSAMTMAQHAKVVAQRAVTCVETIVDEALTAPSGGSGSGSSSGAPGQVSGTSSHPASASSSTTTLGQADTVSKKKHE